MSVQWNVICDRDQRCKRAAWEEPATEAARRVSTCVTGAEQAVYTRRKQVGVCLGLERVGG